MYKRIISVLIAGFMCVAAFAQTNSKTTIAPFKITLVNGKTYTYKELAKGKPTILVYFSPTCDHCKHFTEAMLKRKKELADKQIVMVAYEPLNLVKKFDDEYHLSSNPNIKVGTEGYTFIIQKYYNVQRFPFVAEYDKKGKLAQIVPYNSQQPEEMAAKL
jgi:thioredoxin-related protein